MEQTIKTLSNSSDIVQTVENFITRQECKEWIKMIYSPQLDARFTLWGDRTTNITHYPIVKKLSEFIKKNFKKNLTIYKAEIQNWNEDSFSNLHIHSLGDKRDIQYNSSIYLNNNYDGGEFFTQGGIKIKPKLGLLTFFDGQKVYHGVTKVKNGARFSLIFWWNK